MQVSIADSNRNWLVPGDNPRSADRKMYTAIIPGLQEALQGPKGEGQSYGHCLLEVATAGLYVAETPSREGRVEKPLGDGQLTNIGC